MGKAAVDLPDPLQTSSGADRGRALTSTDDLLALADAVREAGRPLVEATRAPGEPVPTGAGRETARRGHLRVLTSE